MLYTPVSGSDLAKRLGTLVVAPIIIMVVQFIIHSKKSKEMNIEVEKSEVLKYDEVDYENYKEIEVIG